MDITRNVAKRCYNLPMTFLSPLTVISSGPLLSRYVNRQLYVRVAIILLIATFIHNRPTLEEYTNTTRQLRSQLVALEEREEQALARAEAAGGLVCITLGTLISGTKNFV